VATQDERRAATLAAIKASARRLFASAGFEATSVDDIAAHAGVTKGAFYHYFDSKERVFEEILEAVQSELAAGVREAAAKASSPLDSLDRGVRQFFVDCARRDVRQILLTDGPAVLGWKRWREIDARHFGALLRQSFVAIRGGELRKNDAALIQLLLGACTEAALVCASSKNPQAAARDFIDGLQILVTGVFSRRS
jgi:AcrR family transcriptional regulator